MTAKKFRHIWIALFVVAAILIFIIEPRFPKNNLTGIGILTLALCAFVLGLIQARSSSFLETSNDEKNIDECEKCTRNPETCSIYQKRAKFEKEIEEEKGGSLVVPIWECPDFTQEEPEEEGFPENGNDETNNLKSNGGQ